MPYEEFDSDDPMDLVGMVLPGEPGQLEAMAECFVEEYVRMGWDEPRLMTLFINPLFMATHRIYRLKGDAYVRRLIQKVVAKWGFRETPETLPRSVEPGARWNEGQSEGGRLDAAAQ
jgi:hypothetical protein